LRDSLPVHVPDGREDFVENRQPVEPVALEHDVFEQDHFPFHILEGLLQLQETLPVGVGFLDQRLYQL
jgi:hypothetical protein